MLLCFPAIASAWPTDSQWIPLYKGGNYLQDPNGDAQGSRNVVSDPNNDAAFMYNNGQYVYFRLRLDQDPTGTGGQGFLKSFGWGVEIDTNLNSGDYEWLLMVDGISKTEVVSLQHNSVQGTLGDPGDQTESVCATVPISTNHQVIPANTSINGDQDYYLDWRFPYSTFKQCTGLTDTSPLRLFFGSSPSTNNLTEAGADLLGASDLIAGFSDYVTAYGTRPTTGLVKFVADLLGSNDVTVVTAGQTIYIRVEDADLNYNNAVRQTLTVVLTTTGGDSETLTLTETGVDTGIFSASIPSFNGPRTSANGTVEVSAPDEIVTVTYIDGLDATLKQNQPRTDTLTILLPPAITVTKAVTPIATAAGGTVTYTITISNSGFGEGFITQITDVLPAGFTYRTGTTTGLTTNNPTINGQVLTWTGAWTIPRKTGVANGTATFSFQTNAGSVAGTYYNNVSVSGSNFAVKISGDTAPVMVTAAPLMSLIKSADKAGAKPGEELIYSIYYRNLGHGPAHTLIIMDTVPMNTAYVAGSLKSGNAASTYDTADTSLTDGPGETVPGNVSGEVSGSNIIFTINVVSPNDGVANSGADEGKVYFKVKVN
ncbi:MAG: hypothetical protein P1P89_18860 [Desulfobacterales bacterium]|nr:hypothetical protein [Desulfobacterales bacterium]